MPLQATSGAASYDAFGGGVPFVPTYIEDVFSTYLYTGNGEGALINNGIALGTGPTNGTVLQLTGDTLTDVAPQPATLTNTGSVSVSTSTKKYGTGSLSFNGSNYLTGGALQLLGDFTLQAWVNLSAPNDVNSILSRGFGAAGGFLFWVQGTLRFRAYNASGSQFTATSSASISANTWTHVAAVRSGSTISVFVDGVLSGSVTFTGAMYNTSDFQVGTYSSGSGNLNGYIDDLKLQVGVAAYTSDFTPPASALPLDTLTTGKGGLTWIKQRSTTRNHVLFDTVRGATKPLYSNLTAAEGSDAQSLTAFTSTGFSVGSDSNCNINAGTYVSWTFREQAKFFDVVTYTGNDVAGRQIAHSLGSAPGCVIIKPTSFADNWRVWHLSVPTQNGVLNSTGAFSTAGAANRFGDGTNVIAPTSTVFTVGSDGGVNSSGQTYVAYLFAHDAGGFGLSGSDNVISCGDFTTNSSGVATVNLGYEPQWLLIKQTTGTRGWFMYDNMRGMFANGGAFELLANSTASEQDYTAYNNIAPTATGFVTGSGTFYSSTNYIYIAIRRGPMKTPTSGTSVYNAVTYTGNQTARNITGYGFPLDLVLGGRRNDTNNFKDYWFDRLRGATKAIDTNVSGGTAAEYTDAQVQTSFALQDGTSVGTDSTWNATGINIVLWGLRRAPGFFDEVCYTGNGVDNRDITHNLGVAPELLIVKNRSAAGGTDWPVYAAPIGATQNLYLNDPGNSFTSNNYWRDSTPTATTFRVGTNSYVNANTNTYVAYLFATCPGVSKVGGYTGSGTTKQIDCGFTGGARFVMIKRTDSNGDWYVWDSTRGIVAGNDPYLLMNSTAAEVTNTDYIDTYSAGFEISSTAPAAINANGGSFVFLAIA